MVACLSHLANQCSYRLPTSVLFTWFPRPRIRTSLGWGCDMASLYHSGSRSGGSSPTPTPDVQTVSVISDNPQSLVAGTPVYAKSNGHVDSAKADDLSTLIVVGLVKSAPLITGAPGNIQAGGAIVLSADQWDAVIGQSGGLTPGARYFLSDIDAGRLTSTVTSSIGSYVTPIGRAVTSTTMLINLETPVRV